MTQQVPSGFWLDDPGRHNAYHLDVDPESFPPEVSQEALPPLVFAKAAQLKTRRFQPRALLVAVAIALIVHAGLVAALYWPWSHTRIDAPQPAATGTLFASLVPASSLSLSPSALPPLSPATITQSEPPIPLSRTLTPSAEEQPPAESQVPPAAQSALANEATLNTSNVATTSPEVVHEDTDNPWAHASVPAPVLTMGQKLWAAIKPCWEDHGQGPSSIRLILDDQGRVQTMTDLEGREARANPKVQALAHATLACAPYDRLVQSAGSYLVIAPG